MRATMHTNIYSTMNNKIPPIKAIYSIFLLTTLFTIATYTAAPAAIHIQAQTPPARQSRRSNSCPNISSPERGFPEELLAPERRYEQAQRDTLSAAFPTRCRRCGGDYTPCARAEERYYPRARPRPRPSRLDSYSHHRPRRGSREQHSFFPEEYDPDQDNLSPRDHSPYSPSNRPQNNRYSSPRPRDRDGERDRDRERDHWENMHPYRNYPILGLILLCYDNYPKLTLAAIAATAGISVWNYDKIIELYKETKERVKTEFLRINLRYIQRNEKAKASKPHKKINS